MENFPRYVTDGSNLLRVKGEFLDFTEDELELGKGYVYEGNVYEFIDPAKSDFYGKFPSIFYDIDGNLHTEPDLLGKLIPASKIKSNSLDEIINKTNDDDSYYKENDVASINDGEIYEPEISEDEDDFLKRILKTVFRIKQTTVARFRKKFKKPYGFTNLFQGLNKKTKISVTTWQTWVELLCLDVTIIVNDNGKDVVDGFDDVIIYTSKNNQIKVISQEELHEEMKNIENEITRLNN